MAGPASTTAASSPTSPAWPTSRRSSISTTGAFRAALARIACPTLVMAGDSDPITPMAFSETIAASLPPPLVRFERFTDCGPGVVRDAPERHFAVLREFMRP